VRSRGTRAAGARCARLRSAVDGAAR
jgi:hypothetical protein